MIRENQRILNFINALTDGMILFVSYLIATYIRFYIMYGSNPALEIAWNQEYFTAAILFAIVEVIFLFFSHIYSVTRRSNLSRELGKIVGVGFFSVLSLMAFLYFTRLVDFSRIAIIIYYVLSTVILLAKRLILRSILKKYRLKGYNLKHVVLVGDGYLAKQYLDSLKKNPELGYTVDGYVSMSEKEELGKRLGAFEDLESILDRPGIDEVVIALEMHEVQHMKKIIAACDKSGIKICIIPYFNDFIPANPSVDTIGDSRIINIREIPLDNIFNAFLKRLFDIIGSLLLIIITSPVMLIVAIGVKTAGGPGPILFKQIRMGKNKRNFTMLKFRSMKVNDEENTAWSTDTDPRKTKFGSFIRKFSLDELPQFFNVLFGDMSLIGPRPELPHFIEQFKEEIPLYLVRQQERPGITGWAQVNGLRGDTSISERIKYDIWYIENWSVFLDIKILFRTIFGGMMNSEKLK